MLLVSNSLDSCLRGKWTINDPTGRVWQPYVLVNVSRQFISLGKQ
jgi:hypothetical protein